MNKYNPGPGNFSYNYLASYEKKPNVTFINKWIKNYDYNWGNTKSGYFDTMTLSNNSKVIMGMDVESEFLVFVDAMTGELILKINVEGTGNLNINGGILLHQNSSNTYAAYYVMRKAPYYKVACLDLNFTANPATIVTSWTLVSIQNQTMDTVLGINRGSYDDSKLYVLGYQNSNFMLSRIYTNNGSSIFDKYWASSNFLGVYDGWLNYTGSCILERTLDVSTEVVAIGYTDSLGKLTLIIMKISDDNNPAIVPAALP